MASIGGPSQALAVHSAADLWGKALSSITIKDGISLDFAQTNRREVLVEVLELVQKAEQTCQEKRWKWKNRKGEYIIIRDIFAKMTVWIEKFKAVGNTIVQYDPGHAALPWAATHFILQAAINDIQTNAAMLEGLELVLSLITKYEVVEALYLRTSCSISRPLEDNIVKLYTAILEYLLQAHRYFTQKTVTRIAKSVFQLDDITTAFVTKIKTISNNVNEYLQLASTEAQRNAQANVNELTEHLANLDIEKALSKAIKSFEDPINRTSTQLPTIEDNLLEGERLKIFEWLSKDQYMSHHRSKSKALLPGSGQWLLNKPEFVEWMNSSSSSILWLHGIPGSGKSMLVAHVIEYIQSQNSSLTSPAPLAIFYCARNTNEPERADPEELLRTILEQLSCSDEEMPIREPVVAAYKTRKKEARGRRVEKLGLEDTAAVILQLLQTNPATVVIDGLDECDPTRRQDLLDALQKIIHESSNIIKVFVSSRDDHDLVHRLSQTPNIYIHATENTKDIRNFVETRLHNAISKQRILCGRVSRGLEETIINTLMQKAHGMFRLVSLHIESLCDPHQIKTKENVLVALNRLPEDLKRSYDTVLAQIQSSHPPNPELADRVIKWLLCAREPLAADTFLVAVCSDRTSQELITQDEILSICNNLVIYDEETKMFRFAHLSVQEYLLHLTAYSHENSNAMVAEQCLSWLFTWEKVPSNQQQLLLWTHQFDLSSDDHPVPIFNTDHIIKGLRLFTHHADMFWATYVKNAGGIMDQGRLKLLLQRFLLFNKESSRSNELAFSRWIERVVDNRQTATFSMMYYPESAPPSLLFVACAFNFPAIATELLRESTLSFTATSFHGTNCAQIAARSNNPEIISTLLNESRGLQLPTSYWHDAVNSAISYRSAEVLEVLLSSLGKGFFTQIDLDDFMRSHNYSEGHCENLLPIFFRNNPQLLVTEDLFLVLFEKTYMDLGPRLVRHVLPFMKVEITHRLINVAVVSGNIGQRILLELLSTDRPISFKSGVPEAIMSFGDSSWTCAVLKRKEINPAELDRTFSFYPRTHQLQHIFRRAREEGFGYDNTLLELLQDQSNPELEITWKELVLAKKMKLGTENLLLILEVNPRISTQTINTVVAEWDEKIVSAMLQHRTIEVTDEIIKHAARNVKHGQQILTLLLEKELEEAIN